MNMVILPQPGFRHAVVANDRIGHSKDLARIRGISQSFGIANHASAEDKFSSSWTLIAERKTLEARAILQNESSSLGSITESTRDRARILMSDRSIFKQ